MCNVPQQDTTNTTDCCVFVCIYCNFILNDCKLDFKQEDITNSDWRDRMILSILSVKPKNGKEINNDDEVTLSAIKVKWNNKQKNIARASAWSLNLIMNKNCKANKDDKMDYNDDCNGGLDCKNKRVQKCLWKKVHLYDAKRQKPTSMLIWQVQAIIIGKFEVCSSKATIACYAKHGLINTSPMKMGPGGHILVMEYKFFYQAYPSLIPINQMNVCTGDNSRKKMIRMLAKTFDIRMGKATGLLNCILHDMATDIDAKKLNCVEDHQIHWTTYQNLLIWFNSWEVFLVDYGIATTSQTGELIVEEKMKKQIANLDKTCLLLDRHNRDCGGYLTVTYYDVCFSQLGKAMLKSALMIISRSNAAGKPISPHFQFQTSAQMAKAEVTQIEMLCYMLGV